MKLPLGLFFSGITTAILAALNRDLGWGFNQIENILYFVAITLVISSAVIAMGRDMDRMRR